MTSRPFAKLPHALHYFLRRLPTCKQMSALMSQSLERRLTVRERVQLRLHLWTCIWCVWYLEHLQLLHATLQQHDAQGGADEPTTELQLSREARERIKRALESNS